MEMHDVKRWKIATLLALVGLAAGCSSNSDKQLPPAELPDFTATVEFDKQWSRSVGDGQGKYFNRLTPVIDGDRIFATDLNGTVMAIDRFSGDKIWTRELEKPVSGGVAVGGGLVLLGTLKGEVIALHSDTGKRAWSARVPGEVLAAPATNGSVVVVQTQDDKVVGLDANDGEQLWVSDNTPAVLSLRGTSAPLVTSELAIAGLSSGRVIALEAQRGLPLWQQRVAAPKGRSELERIVDIDGGLLLADDTLFVVTFQGRVAALNVQGGQVLWQRDASSYVGLGQGFGSVYVSLADGTVEGIDERSTSALWSNDQLLRRQLTAPVPVSSYLAVGDFEGYLHLLSQVDGQYLGRVRVDSDGLRVAPLVVDNWVYAFGNSGDLVAFTID
jgi:outer membrane protein assembly factor BamB